MLGGLVSEPDRTPVGDGIVLEEGEQMLHAKDRFQRVLEPTISDTGTSDDGVERLGALGNVVVVASPDPLVRLRIPLTGASPVSANDPRIWRSSSTKLPSCGASSTTMSTRTS